MLKPWLGIFLMAMCFGALPVISQAASSDLISQVANPPVCSQFSSKDSDDFWVSVGRCPSCTEEIGCGFCESTLQCLDGTATGPSNSSPCASWSFEKNSCPAVPNCEEYFDCSGCASQDQCAWCASENLCTTISEAFSRDCRGLVFEPPCPDKFVSGNF
jgi:hypothetical protein